jgi:Zn-dependent protease
VDPVQILCWILPVVLAVTLHEVAHGWAARGLGDPTAAEQGRLSLNPIRHLDPIGTLLVPAVLALTSGFIFGWAKPVPVNFRRLRRPRRDMALVALAGPGANLLMIVAWTAFTAAVNAAQPLLGAAAAALIYMGWQGIIANSVLMLLNLVPIPPLDGSRVVTACLPLSLARPCARLELVGLVLVLALLATGALERLLGPPFALIRRLAAQAAGL